MLPELDIPAIIAARPVNEDVAPLLVDTATAHITRAADIVKGDTILAIVIPRGDSHEIDWFNEEYTASPKPYDPTCGCGVCTNLADESGPVVNLGHDNPWEVCDPMPADELVLIVPAA